MALTVPNPIHGQSMVLDFIGKNFTHCQQSNYNLKQKHFEATLHCKFEVLLELCRKLDNVFRLAHAFKSANNSSVLVYPFTEGSFAILSASSMAAIVS